MFLMVRKVNEQIFSHIAEELADKPSGKMVRE